MKLEEALLASLDDAETPVKGAWIGLHWTLVESRHCGMAHTYTAGREVRIRDAGKLCDLKASDVARRLMSWDPAEASLGVAAINSLLEPGGKVDNVNEMIKREAAGKRVATVGRFPFRDELAGVASEFYALEILPLEGEFPAPACEEILPTSDVNVISATTLINHTLQRLLELGSGGRNFVIGPSTPLSPVLFDFGADFLAGVRVLDRDPMVRYVVQGTKRLKHLDCMEKVYVERG